MNKNIALVITIVTIIYANTALANKDHQSKYSGQQTRVIKSLSMSDIKQLEQGKGWGLAKAAELNGVPGPSHLLQMKDKISLTKDQTSKIQALFDTMKRNAIPLGKRLVHLEKGLNDSFANKSINRKSLMKQLEEIAQVRKELRFVHLATHLETPAILTQHQIHQYNELRGYNKKGGMQHHNMNHH